jgi:hypothetical protein
VVKALHQGVARPDDGLHRTAVGHGDLCRHLPCRRTGRFEIEHIWADHYERHTDEFTSPADFYKYRDHIAGLLLLPKNFNASYGDLTYEDKLPHYNAQNLLARSLHPRCYDHNPGFLQFRARSGLRFAPHAQFKKADLDARAMLYRQIAECVWNPNDLLVRRG